MNAMTDKIEPSDPEFEHRMETAIRLYESGFNVRDVCMKAGVRFEDFYRAAAMTGVRFRRTGIFKTAIIRRIAKHVKFGMTVAEIARLEEMERDAVIAVIHEARLPVPPTAENRSPSIAAQARGYIASRRRINLPMTGGQAWQTIGGHL